MGTTMGAPFDVILDARMHVEEDGKG